MAVCGSLQYIFDKPLPENPTLFESISQWNRRQMKTRKSTDQSSFSEIFGELHFHEKNNPDSSSSSPDSPFSLQSLLIEDKDANANANDKEEKEKDISDITDDNPSPSSSTRSSLSLSSSSSLDIVDIHSQRNNLLLCTEGLGSESGDDVEDPTPHIANNEGFVFDDANTNEEDEEEEEEEEMGNSSLTGHFLSSFPDRNNSFSRRSSFGSGSGAPSFPPPISCIGKSGKPWVCFRSYRRDGRFVLKEVRIPTQEFLRAWREDGRLRLHFVQPDEEIPEEEDEEEENEEEDNVVDQEEVVGGEKGEAGDKGDGYKYQAEGNP